ncbi:hypothetical protein KJ564_02385 [bacterium]|nr:hypothetical protein [bacterium]
MPKRTPEPQEYCPQCEELREVTMTRTRRQVILPGGEKKRVGFKIYHCDSCQGFIRNEMACRAKKATAPT